MLTVEHIKPYDAAADKATQVEQMFNDIAPCYDRMNGLLSVGIDRRWRRTATRALAVGQPRQVLDVATGTADFAIGICRKLPETRVVGVDLSGEMLCVGQGKVDRLGFADRIRLEQAWADRLPYDDGAFDAVTVAFGLRNFAPLSDCLREMHRVLRVGGRLVALELSEPVRSPMRQLFRLYAHTVIPAAGRLIAHDRSAYAYLTRSIEAFPQAEDMCGMLTSEVGFGRVDFRRLTAGICTLYVAIK